MRGQLRRSVARAIGGLWGDEPTGADDIFVVRVADFENETLAVREPVPTLRHVPGHVREPRLLSCGDLLIEKSGGGDRQNVGRVMQWQGDGHAICSNFIAVLRPAPEFASRYLTYVHRSLYARGVVAGCTKQTTGIQNLDLAAYLATRVDFPTRGSQKRIADFLDRECERIARSMTQVERLPNLARAHFVSRRAEALSSAQTVSLGRTVTVLDHLRVPLNRQERESRPGPYPYWGANAIQGYVDGYLFDEELVLVSEDGGPFFDDARDVAWCVEGRTWVNNHAHILRPRPGWDPVFLAEALNTVDYSEHVTGATRDKLTQERLKSIRVPGIKYDKQVTLATELRRLAAQVTRADELTRRMTERLREYRDALITEAITGQLDVTRLSHAQLDESAHAALEGETPEVLAS